MEHLNLVNLITKLESSKIRDDDVTSNSHLDFMTTSDVGFMQR